VYGAAAGVNSGACEDFARGRARAFAFGLKFVMM
jgi:hypothetical protein